MSSLLEDLSDFEVAPPPPGNVHRLAPTDDPVMAQWARFRDGFAKAIEGTLYSLDEVEQAVATKRAILFAGKASAVVAEINGDTMQLMWATGEVPELLSLLPGIEAVARMRGCVRVFIEGPEGWKRLLKGAGYGFYSVTVAKEL